jgi:predicted RNA-binding Zn ribbon-like protein
VRYHDPAKLDLIAGDPALDFANTRGGARGAEPDEEFLGSYGDVAAWAAIAGVVDEATAAGLAEAAGRRPDAAETAFGRAHALRAAIVAVFEALATAGKPAAPALAELSAFDAAARGHARLTPAGDGFALTWDADDLERPLWPVAVAAVDLLREGPVDRVKLCDHCCWMFLDVSRNRSRRWCSMNNCGGNEKMRRYRARRRATAGR